MNSEHSLSVAVDTSRLKPGFADAVHDAQAAFRAVLDAMAYAGRIQQIETGLDAPEPLHAGMAAVALTLFDFDTSVWLDAEAAAGPVPAWLKFHCGSPLVAQMQAAQFGLIADAANLPALENFAIGEDKYPDRSATLIVQVPSLTDGPETVWTGPGVDGSIAVRIAGLPEGFWAQWDDNHGLYPLGVDIIFVSGTSVVGLPRGIKVRG
jgi:alpha-D-ribose 1-methylphosphonate 5-triphosphate synthase subunit PhnH